MKILLISGHGASDPGATACIGGRQYRESVETREMSALVAAALRNRAEVTIYPTARNAYEDCKNGALAVDFKRFDYVLELHFNAFSPNADGKTKGVECYVTPDEQGITVEQAICKKIAALGLTNRGVKRHAWAVISAAKRAGVSSALLEICFLDDEDDMRVYLAKKLQFAAAIAAGIAEGFSLADSPAEANRRLVQQRANLSDKTMDYLAAYQYGDALLEKLAAAMQ